MNETIDFTDPLEPPVLVKARAIAEIAADWAAEQIGHNGVPWAMMTPEGQRGMVGAVVTQMAIAEALEQYKRSLS